MNQGFTLLELLIVISIIGSLSGGILMSVNSAREQGHESKVISQMEQMKKAAAILYLEEGNYDSLCEPDSISGEIFHDTVYELTDIFSDETLGMNKIFDCLGGDSTGSVGATTYRWVGSIQDFENPDRTEASNDWAVQVLLNEDGFTVYCIDSRGHSVEYNSSEGSRIRNAGNDTDCSS